MLRRLKKRCQCISCGWAGRRITQRAIPPLALRVEQSTIRTVPANVGSVAARSSSCVHQRGLRVRPAPSKQLERTVMHKVPRHIGQRAAAELRR